MLYQYFFNSSKFQKYKKYIYELLLILVILLIIDTPYLLSLGRYSFVNMIEHIQGTTFELNLIGTFLSYSFMMLSFYRFIVMEKKQPYDAFLFGLSIYGVFNFTNMALFKHYSWFSSITDTLWGGILFYLTCFTYNITHKYVL